MKNHVMRFTITPTLASAVLGALLASTPLAAQDARQRDAGTNRSTRAESSRTQQRGADAEAVRVTRASNFLGMDVIASDGRKVGDIVDYYFNLSGAPHLAYVVVMTGGFLDLGGDTRAVPASAITSTGDNCRLAMRSSDFWDVPVLPENRQRFISDPQHRQRLSQFFRNARPTVSTDKPGDAQNNTTAATSDDPNRAGAMTGRASGDGARLVSYNKLRNAEAYGENDRRLGYFMDAWINLNDNRAPYVEITPTFQPFRTSFDRRYAIPTAKLAGEREYYGYNVKVTTDELNEAEPVSETEGVKMLAEGRFGNDVLRVTVPDR